MADIRRGRLVADGRLANPVRSGRKQPQRDSVRVVASLPPQFPRQGSSAALRIAPGKDAPPAGRRYSPRGYEHSRTLPRPRPHIPAEHLRRDARPRAEERRVGKERVSTCSSWWSPDTKKK